MGGNEERYGTSHALFNCLVLCIVELRLCRFQISEITLLPSWDIWVSSVPNFPSNTRAHLSLFTFSADFSVWWIRTYLLTPELICLVSLCHTCIDFRSLPLLETAFLFKLPSQNLLRTTTIWFLSTPSRAYLSCKERDSCLCLILTSILTFRLSWPSKTLLLRCNKGDFGPGL